MLHTLPNKVIVLGIEEPDEGGVDGTLIWQLHRTLRQDLQYLGHVRGLVSLEDTCKSLQINLQRGSTFLLHSERISVSNLSRWGVPNI